MEHGRLLYLSLKNYLHIMIFSKHLSNNKPEQLCEQQKQHLGHKMYSPPKKNKYVNLFERLEFVNFIYLRKPFHSRGPLFPAQHLITC